MRAGCLAPTKRDRLAQSRWYGSPRDAGTATAPRSITFRSLAKAYTGGTVRPASEAERQVLYDFVPFEIENMPITTVELGSTLLIVVLADGKLSWLDTPSEYGRDSRR